MNSEKRRQHRYARLLQLSSTANPVTLPKALKILMSSMYEAAFLDSEAEALLNALSASTGVGIRRLQRDWQALLKASAPAGDGHISETGGYRVIDGALYRQVDTRDGPTSVAISNFTAQIVREELYDDGADQTVTFAVEGKLASGRPLPLVSVPAEQFHTMTWVPRLWGTGPIIYAGQSTRDHVRAAIQVSSPEVERRTVFTHLGWRKVEGRWVYLHSGGAIGEEGAVHTVAVSLSDSTLKGYRLPDPPKGDELRRAVRASLELLKLAPSRITYPLLSAVYRAPLCEVSPIDMSLAFVGSTGVFKTELSALGQAHYGAEFSGRKLPGNWTDTSNTLEKKAFLAKDAVLVIDDFSPTGTASDVARTHRDAERLLRAQGNQAGRGRMRADGSLRTSYYPRGFTIFSGEDAPKGHSLQARILFVEVARDDVNTGALTKAQEDASMGFYAAAMAGYVSWLARRLDTLSEELVVMRNHLRGEVSKVGSHRRTPDQIATLACGWRVFLRFALDAGVINIEEAAYFWREGCGALRDVALAQTNLQAAENPVTRFIELLRAAISSGQVYVADVKANGTPEHAERWGWRHTSGTWQPQGKLIGWVDGENLLLEPDAAFACVQNLARAQGENIAMGRNTLWKRMKDQGLILSKDADRNTVRWTITGERQPVIHLNARLLSTESVPNVPSNEKQTKRRFS